jgi:hypothetical protein
MSREELLALLQDKGLSDDDIKALLKDTLDTLDKDFYDHDKKEEEQNEENEEQKMKDVFGI